MFTGCFFAVFGRSLVDNDNPNREGDDWVGKIPVAEFDVE